jgi:hypothetical protein
MEIQQAHLICIFITRAFDQVSSNKLNEERKEVLPNF